MEGEKIDYSKLTEEEIRKKAEDMSTVFDAAQKQKEKEETEEEKIKVRIPELRMEDYEKRANGKETSAAWGEIMNKLNKFKDKFKEEMLKQIGYKGEEKNTEKFLNFYSDSKEAFSFIVEDFKYKIERVKTNLDLYYVCEDAESLTFEEFKKKMKSFMSVPGESKEK